MAIFNNNLLAGAGAQSSASIYKINQSIRFNSADSAYMHRTPSSSGNRKTFTSSFWVKLGDTTDCALPFPSVYQNASYGAFLSSGVIQFFIYYTGSAWQGQLYTNRVFRDPAAWYHFVIVVDTTQATSTERVRIYVNGQRETIFSTENYPNQNQDTDWNNSGEKMGIGVNANGFGGSFGEYYAAEMHYLDGYAYGPEYFGETNDSGIWIPKEYDGSYGTNGFKIDGRDSSDLGDDESGQGNDFTVVNLAAHDQVGDSPTNNFCTANPLDSYYFAGTFKDGNLDVTTSGATGNYTFHTTTQKIPTSGKWYTEVRAYEIGAGCYIGITQEPTTAINVYLGQLSTTWGYNSGGNLYTNNSGSSYGNSYTNGDIIGIAVDMDNNKLYFSKNGTFQDSGDPTSGSTGTGAISITGGVDYFLGASDDTGAATTSRFMWNFGQDGTFCNGVTAQGNKDASGIGNFYYSVPSGYKALCTKNLGS